MSQPSEGPAGEARTVTNSDDAFVCITLSAYYLPANVLAAQFHFLVFSTCLSRMGSASALYYLASGMGEDMDRTPFFLDARVYDGGRRRILI